MVTQKPKAKLTYEDYAKTPEGERWELIDGELIMAPSPKEAHQSVQVDLGAPMHLFAPEPRTENLAPPRRDMPMRPPPVFD